MTFTRQNSGAAWAASDNADAATVFEPGRQNEEAAIFQNRMYVGGSRSVAVMGTGYQDPWDYVPMTNPSSVEVGGVYSVEVDLQCEDAATTITPKIRNVTDSTDTVIGSAHASTSVGSQTLSFTPVAGKVYRLMFVKSDDLFAAYGIGFLQRKAA